MSGQLDYIAEGLSQRLELRRRMLAHLGMRVEAEEAEAILPELRETVMACGQCHQPEICQGWLDHGHTGVPMFCKARTAFRTLRNARDHRTPAA